MKPNLKAIIFVSSLFIAFLLVKYSGNFVNGCPTSSLTPNTSADSPGCNLGFPLPYIMTGGFTGGWYFVSGFSNRYGDSCRRSIFYF